MKEPNQFVVFVLEQMRGLGPVRSRPMFGGYGIYFEDLMFGLVAYDTLYFKTDELNRPEFEEAGSAPFTFEANGKSTVMSYFQAPDEVMDDEAAMQHWAESGLAAAKRVQVAKTVKKAKTRR